MTPCSATVWYALLLNAGMRRSVLASSSTRGGVQQPAGGFISTVISSRRGASSFVSGVATGGGWREASGLARGSRSPSCSSLAAVNRGGGHWVQPQPPHHHRRAARIGRQASRPTPSRVEGGLRRGLSMVTSVGSGTDARDASKAGRSTAEGEGMRVTVLSGFLGAGKTTLMQNVLRQAREQRVSLAVIVNDMADVNIDAQLLARGGNGEDAGGSPAATSTAADASAEPARAVDSITSVALEGGCICCTIKEEFVHQVEDIARGGKHQHLIIESTGISDPMPVAQALVESDVSSDSIGDDLAGDHAEEGAESRGGVAVVQSGEAENHAGAGGEEGELFSVDTLVTVVDSTTFMNEVREADYLDERGMEADEGDTRTIADLLVAQVEFANVILLNKADLVAEADLATLEGVVRGLNPAARVVRTVSSDVGLAEVLGTGEFDLDEASQAAGWVQALNHDHDHAHAHGGAGGGGSGGSITRSLADIGSFTFRAQRPFHPERLMGFVMEHLPSVLRSKGFLWLATRNDEAGVWTQAGGSFATEYGGLWEEDDDDDDDNEEEEGGGGDEGEHKEGGRDGSDGAGSHAGRTTELVFIGLGMDHDALKAELRLCLLTDEEIEGGPEAWRERFEDPFPPWQ